MKVHKPKTHVRFDHVQYQNAREKMLASRNVEAQWALLTKMIDMGFRPHRADLAKALYDHIQLERPRLVPREILTALLGELLREGRRGPREITTSDFLSRVDAPVQVSRSLYHQRRLAKKKGAYEGAIRLTAKRFQISKNTLEMMRKRYNEMVKKADYSE